MEFIKKLTRFSAVSTIFVRRPLTRLTSSFPPIENLTEDQESHDITVNNDEPVPDMPNPFEREKQKCILCQMNIRPDWKNARLLSQFQSPFTGRIYGRHITGLCVKKQTEVAKEIIKAQNAGFMPYYLKDPGFLKDPKLYNPEKPSRSHPY